MDFRNTQRLKNKMDGSRSTMNDQTSRFDPSETKQLKNPRVSLEKNSTDFIPRVIDTNSFNFDNITQENLPHEEDVCAIGNFISRNKIIIGIVIVILIITMIVIYLWYYYNKKKKTNTLIINNKPVMSNTDPPLTSTLKINKPAAVNSLSDESEAEAEAEEVKKTPKKKSKNKQSQNTEKITVPTRKSVLEKSKEELDKNMNKSVEEECDIFTKKEPEVKHRSNINLTRAEDSDEESAKFYNN